MEPRRRRYEPSESATDGLKRSLKGFKQKHRSIFILVIVIGVMCLFTSIWFVTPVFSDPDFDIMAVLNAAPYRTKVVSVNDFESNKLVFTPGDNTQTGSSGGASPMLGDGKLITDASKNPKGVPLYDGYTESGDSFFVDYSRFWNESGELAGLGDWTNKDAKNAVSYEFISNNPAGSSKKIARKTASMRDFKEMGGFWTSEGRICVALPPGSIIDPVIFEPLIADTWTNTAKYTGSDGGTKALQHVPGVWSSDLGFYGMHVDCVLEDGTVLALVLMDMKALHTGIYSNGDDCRDNLLNGYAQWRGKSGKRSYAGILEVAVTSDYNSSNASVHSDLNLSGNKIVGFKVYTGTKGSY